MEQTIDNGKFMLTISQSHDNESPREWDNIGRMICWHSKFELGDEHVFDNCDFDEFKAENELVCLPVYLCYHSGLSVSTTPFSCNWDSGQIGFIYCDKETIIKEFDIYNNETIEKVKSYLKNEVKTYAQYLRGEVYGYQAWKMKACEQCGKYELEEIDSCWGFYGSDHKENGMYENFPEDIQKLYTEKKDEFY